MARVTRRNIIIAAIVVGIPVLAIGWWLGSPLFLVTEVSEEFPMSAGAIVPGDMTQQDIEDEMLDASQTDSKTSEDMPSDGPNAVTSGVFADFDSFHRGTGTATIYQLEDGSHIVRFEDFEVTNGPDLHVLLVPASDPGSRDDVAGYVDLGRLKGSIGNQNYEIPAGVDPADYGSVVIYCEPFHVIFSVATLG